MHHVLFEKNDKNTITICNYNIMSDKIIREGKPEEQKIAELKEQNKMLSGKST